MTGPIVVTGAGGFVGRHVVRELATRASPVVAIEHRWRSRDELAALIPAAPGPCIHLGWYAQPQDYLVAVQTNAAALWDTLTLAEVLDARGCPLVAVAGTSAEYAPSRTAVDEDAPLAPTTVYGAAKALCHALLGGPAAPRRTRLAWLRLFNVVGPGEHPDRVVPLVARRALAGRPVDLSAGTQVRDYVDVRDVARAFVDVALGGHAGVFNVSTGRGTPLRDILTLVATEAGHPDVLRLGARPTRSGEAEHVVGDPARLRAVCGWEPERSLEETAAAIVAWWRSAGRARQ